MGQNETFGEWLRRHRLDQNLTLRALAEKLEIKHPYLSQIESNLAMPSEDLARRIAEFFGEDEEQVVFLARNMAKIIEEIKQKFPRASINCFRRIIQEENSKEEGTE